MDRLSLFTFLEQFLFPEYDYAHFLKLFSYSYCHIIISFVGNEILLTNCCFCRRYLKQVAYGFTYDWVDLHSENVHALQPAVVNELHQPGKFMATIKQPRQAGIPLRKLCQLCTRQQENKTSPVCLRCDKYVCATHLTTVTICRDCEA